MRCIISLVISAFIVLPGSQLSSSKSLTPATIQSRDTVQRLYGSPVSEVYRTSQSLTVTASFTSNGSLCRAHIYSANDARITDKQLNPVLDELAPKEHRGKYRIGTFMNVTCLKAVKPENSAYSSSGKPAMELSVDPCAECSGVSEDYERANITRYGNTNQYSSAWITFHQPECAELDKAHH